MKSFNERSEGNLNILGEWWLPNDPGKQIPGVLTYSPDEGIILELMGSFKDIRNIEKFLELEIIIGISKNGEDITLYKCSEISSSYTAAGLSTLFRVNRVFVGAHFQREDDIKFKSVSARFLHLDEWLGISGFESEEQLKGGKAISVVYSNPSEIQMKIGNGYSLSIFFDYAVEFPSRGYYKFNIQQEARIKIEADRARTLRDYEKVIEDIQNFISLGIFWLKSRPFDIQGEMEDGSKVVKIFDAYSLSLGYSLILDRKLMLFEFKDIQDRFEIFLRNWINKAEQLRFIIDSYFHDSSGSWEYRFLSLVQALEAYHRCCFERGEYLSDSEFQKVYNELINVISSYPSEEFRRSLIERLKYANEFSLRKRIKEIFDKYADVLKEFIKDKNRFIEGVIKIRNYYTHRDKKLEKEVKGYNLYSFIFQLKMIIEVCLLAEIGFSLDEIKNLFLKNEVYRWKVKR